MVVISEVCFKWIKRKAILEDLRLNVAPLTYRRYADYSYAPVETEKQAESFLRVLKQNQVIKYTIEKEDGSKQLNFLDITIKNSSKGQCDFKENCKKAITYIQN